MGAARQLFADARHAQILALSAFLSAGLLFFGFRIDALVPPVILGAALGAQAIGARLAGIAFEPRSALITALSLTLLLRVSEPWIAALAAVLAIGSKFAIRVEGRHIFNPANFGLIVVATLLPGAWVSPGQWGAGALTAMLFAFAGLAVSGRAGRWDVALAYLGCVAALVFGRALWLGDPLAIPWRQMQSGALLLFAFFMITDPMTTPKARSARLLFAAATAMLGFILTTQFHRPAGMIEALILVAPLTPVLNRFFQGPAPRWRAPQPEIAPCASSPLPPRSRSA